MNVMPKAVSQPAAGAESLLASGRRRGDRRPAARTSVTWQLPEETPVALQINSEPYTVMMATPADLARLRDRLSRRRRHRQESARHSGRARDAGRRRHGGRRRRSRECARNVAARHGAPSKAARAAGFAASRISRPPSGRCRRSRGPGRRLRRPSGARRRISAEHQPMNRVEPLGAWRGVGVARRRNPARARGRRPAQRARQADRRAATRRISTAKAASC